MYFNMERKLEETEIPVVGKKYKYIGKGCDVHTFGQVYFCEKISKLTSDILNGNDSFWSAPKFSENFVEVIDVEVGDMVLVDEGYLEKYNRSSYYCKYVLVIKNTKHTPENHINVDIYCNPEGGLNVPVSSIKSVKKKSEKEFLSNLETECERKLQFPDKPIGVKHDSNKIPLFTIIFKQFPLAIQAVAKRALAGHNKYIETDSDWQNFARAGEQDPDRYKNAGLRHMLEEGEDTDEGMEGTTHESAVVWNFLADLELKLRRENGEDN